jgi:hypothetical protein
MFEAAGAAGILLEDPVAPKRCGHFADKQGDSGSRDGLKINPWTPKQTRTSLSSPGRMRGR